MGCKRQDLVGTVHEHIDALNNPHLQTRVQDPIYQISGALDKPEQTLTFLNPSQSLAVRVRPAHLLTRVAGIGFG